MSTIGNTEKPKESSNIFQIITIVELITIVALIIFIFIRNNNIFIRLFSSIGRFFDRILITPLTKLFFKFGEWINDGGKFLDKMSGNKSFLLIISLICKKQIIICLNISKKTASKFFYILGYWHPL